MTRHRSFPVIALAFIAAFFEPLNRVLARYMWQAGLITYASPNTLTNLIPTIFAAADVVSRERIGFIPAVSRDSTADRVAMNQVVNVPVVGATTAVAIVPGSFAPDTGGAAPGNVPVTITNQFAVPIAWNGDEQMVVGQTGLYESVMTQRFAQAMRTISNMVESDLGNLFANSSRAYGTPGTPLFGTAGDLSDMAQAIKILEDNGAPTSDLRAVFGTTALANMRGKQSVLFKVNESGSSQTLRQGIIGDIFGAGLGTSAAVKRPVSGTAASYTTNATVYAVGATAITLITGTGTILAGDIVTVAGDTNKYVAASALSGGILTIAEPGLRQVIPAAATAVSVVAAADRNMLFSKSAILLATRTPYMPEGGDMAADVMDVTDPVSGLVYQVAMYRQYRQVHFELGLAWGVKMIAPRHTALIIA